MSPEFRQGEKVTHIRLICTECGCKAEGNHSWTDGSGEICDKCVEEDENAPPATYDGHSFNMCEEWARCPQHRTQEKKDESSEVSMVRHGAENPHVGDSSPHSPSFQHRMRGGRCEGERRTSGVEVSESETIPDFGPKADAAVKAACAQFPTTFHLRNHEGTFRASERISYVSRGVVLVYTQRLLSVEEYKSRYSKPENPTGEDLWVDFAKGTVAELKAQIR